MILLNNKVNTVRYMWAQALLVLLVMSLPTGRTVSQNMRASLASRTIICGLMLCHFWLWLCLFKTAILPCIFQSLSCVSWLGLCGWHLHSHLRHSTWTALFGLCFSLMAFSFYPLLENEPELQRWWWLGFFGLLFSLTFALHQWFVQGPLLGPAEHVAFMIYACISAGFFNWRHSSI